MQMNSPAMRQHLMSPPNDDRRSIVAAMRKGNPEFGEQLDSAKNWHGIAPDAVYAKAKEQGYAPEEIRALIAADSN
jgi:hypothetical protein